MSGVNRLKAQRLTERGLRGKELVHALDEEMNRADPAGEGSERAGISPKRTYDRKKK